jgi:hypothetical protein
MVRGFVRIFSNPLGKSILPAIVVLAVTWTGCTRDPKLQPAGTAYRVAGQPSAAVGEDSGVRMIVDGSRWTGEPDNLREALLPVLVTIENNSGRPLRVRYQEFNLTGTGGFQQAALPPFRIGGTVPGPLVPVSGAFGPSFYGAPFYSPFYGPGFRTWGGPFAWDPAWYGPAYAQWPVQLPTASMLELALPEGVLQGGGRVSGYLYFNRPAREVTGVMYRAELVDARTGEQFGTISIPFDVQR